MPHTEFDNKLGWEPKSPEEAALELFDEVVTLELKNSTGSWVLPSIRFSDYMNTLSHYLQKHGLIPTFKWPYY